MSNVKINFKFKNLHSIGFFVIIIITIFVILLGGYLFNINKNKQFSLFEAFNSNNKNNNIILIGDSILNNSVYVFENESVPDLIKNKMQPEQLFYNFAKDGATIQDCITNLANIPEDKINALESNTSIFVSAGGNDILNSRNSESTINALFEKYLKLISAIKKKFYNEKTNKNANINIVALNLYYPLKPSFKMFHPFIKQWNELLEANQEKNGYKLLKIDSIITGADDIVYDVEPSFKGGKKIAASIV